MIGIQEVKCSCARPNMPIEPMFAFKGSPSSLRIMGTPKRIGDWDITAVHVVVKYPDSSIISKAATRNANLWVVTFDGCETSGKVSNGLEIVADGVDEKGNAVQGYVLGVGDIYILDRDSEVEPVEGNVYYVKYCEEVPSEPHKGNIVIVEGEVKFYDGEEWISFNQDLSEYAKKSELPTKVSQLQNDSQYITKTQVEPVTNQTYAGYALKSWTATGLKPVDIEHKILTKNNFVLENYSATMVIPNDGSKPCHRMYYPYYADWSLSKIGDTTFTTPLALKFGYWLIKRTMSLGGMEFEITVYDGYGWMSEYQGAENTAYLIGFDDSTKTVKDKLYVFVGETKYGTYTQHTITTSSNELSIETYDGQTDVITCTRANKIKYSGTITLASREEVEAKQDALTVPQLDALGVQVGEYQTTVATYSNQTLKFNWTGEVNAQTIADAGLNGGQTGNGIHYIVFGTGVTSIAADTFKGFNLYYVWLSKNIMSIGASAFQNCPWLYCVFLLDDDNAKFSSGTLTIGDSAFADCGRLAYVEFLGYSISSGNNVFTNSPFTIQTVLGFTGLDSRKGIYLKWWRNGEAQAKSTMATKFDVDPSLIHAWNTASVEWASNTFSPTFAFVNAKTQLQPRPVITTYHQCLSGKNSSVTLVNRLNKIWADGTTVSRSDEIAASDFSRELYIRMTAGEDYTGTIAWSTYFDWWIGGTMEELMPRAGETAYFHAWEYEPQHFAVEKIGAVYQKFNDYLPLSGDAEADVVTHTLTADAIVSGHPNTSGTIGPDEEGQHYQGVLVDERSIDIQSSRATQTVDWYGTKIKGDGRITLKEKNADDPVITYDELKLPKTQSNSTRTIATQEWVLEQLATLQARVAALEGNS